MAAKIGLSRATFAQSFKDMLGESMLTHLTRLQVRQTRAPRADNLLLRYGIAEWLLYGCRGAVAKPFNKIGGETPTRDWVAAIP